MFMSEITDQVNTAGGLINLDEQRGLVLILAHHCKDDRNKYPDNDQMSPLTVEGEAQAKANGIHLRKNYFFPDHVLLAGCVRGTETFDHMGYEIAEGGIANVDTLYTKGVNDYIGFIQTTGCFENARNIRTLMVVGRKPAIPDLIEKFCPDQNDAVTSIREEGVYGTVSVLHFPDIDDWLDISSREGFAKCELQTVFKPNIDGSIITLYESAGLIAPESSVEQGFNI